MTTADQYVESLYAQDEDLERALKGIQAEGMPEISIKPGYGRLLTLLVLTSGAKRILEIGALGGYSGICLTRGLSEGGKLTSLELEQKYADIAYRHIAAAGLGDKVEYVIGDANESLEQLGKDGSRFDLFFIDADKASYPNYLDWAIKLANPGAIIIGDNILMHGRTQDENVTSGSVQAMRQFNERLSSDPRLDSVILPAYDGLAIARVK